MPKITVVFLMTFSIALLTSVNVSAKSIADYLVEDDNKLAVMEGHLQPKLNVSSLLNELAHQKNVEIKIVELKDNSGLRYIGGHVSAADLAVYLDKMKSLLGDEFGHYRQNQAVRDQHTFHVTLLSPKEYQHAADEHLSLGTTMTITLDGVGTASKDNKTTYYVVAHSTNAQFYRQKLLLSKKDLHVTLGFSPQDVYGVNKGQDTLIR